MSKPSGSAPAALAKLEHEVVACRRCPRLVAWREQVAETKRAAFAGEEYWGRPLPGFGDPAAAVVVLGLAPAAHGGNRTGRSSPATAPATGCSRRCTAPGWPTSRFAGARRRPGAARLLGAAAVRCAPPANKPTPAERDNCLPYLERELELLTAAAGGGVPGAVRLERAAAAAGDRAPRPRPKFGHGAQAQVGRFTMLGCYHPSQQNTFTGS